MKEREKQCSIPAYDAHYILERKKRDGVKYPCNPCYVPYGPMRAIPLHQTHPGRPIPYGCNKSMSQMFVFSSRRPQTHQIPPKCLLLRGVSSLENRTILYNVQDSSFLAVVVMWFRLAGCLWRSAFILHTHFSLISGDI